MYEQDYLVGLWILYDICSLKFVEKHTLKIKLSACVAR